MPSTVTHRPWPALVALLALLLLTGLVWWRVLHRGDTGGQPQAGGSSSCTAPSASSTPASPSASPGSRPSGQSAPAHALPAPSAVTVKVLNSTTRQGLAGKTQATLIKDGFNSPQTAGNDVKHQNKIKAVAEIRYGAKGRSGARLLEYYFPGAKLVHVSTKRATVTVSLGKKFRHVASPQQVRAAMLADAVTASSTASSSATAKPC